jgi:hypothetical protein
MSKPTSEIEQIVLAAKKDLQTAWDDCQKSEKRCVEFGRKCYDWQIKLREKGVPIGKIWDDLQIPRQTAFRWIQAHLEVEGLKPSRPDRAKTNADIINALASRVKGVQTAVEKIEDDWVGWAKACPKETKNLKVVITAVGEYLVGLSI